MSVALTAVVLIRLDARQRQWVSVADLARMVRLPEDTLRAHLESMADGSHAGFALQREDGLVVAAQVDPERAVALA